MAQDLHHGQEIYVFFNTHGEKGIIGLFISMLIISLICYKTFKIITEEGIEEYSSLIDRITENRKVFSIPMKSMVKIFLLVSFYIMVAGFSAYFFQEFKIHKIFGGILIAILSFVTFYKGIDGVIKINLYLIPILIVVIVLLGFKSNSFTNLLEVRSTNNWSWIKDSILYASYNSIVLVPTIIGLKKYIKNKNNNLITAVFVLLIMFFIGITLYFTLIKFQNEIKLIEIPIIFIANKLGVIYKYIYGFIILVAIFTSAISAGYSFLIDCTVKQKDYKFIAIVICVIAILISNLNFSSLVNLLYPIFRIFRNYTINFFIKMLKKIYSFDITNTRCKK